MSVYTRNQPIAGDDLDVSQPKLVSNTNAADDAMAVDHYPFSNTTANRGFHNTVTQPSYQNPLGTAAAAPPTTTTNPILYCFQPLTGAGGTPTTKLGLLQYSLPTPNNATTNPYGNAVPSPITFIQSPANAISILNAASSPILDFTGVPRSMAMIYCIDYETLGMNVFPTFIGLARWNGTNLYVSTVFGNNLFAATTSGNILQVTNNSGSNMTQVFWTLQLLRVS